MDIKTLDHYRLHEKLSDGINGRIYRAWDSEQKREIVVKIIEKPQNYKQLLHVLQPLKRIKHPNIGSVLDVIGDDKVIYICQERLYGETLKDKILSKNTSDIYLTELLIEMTKGLQILHGKQIVHGNLKPSNIFFTDDNRILLLDACLSQFVHDHNDPYFIPSYEAYHYLAPEQLTGEHVSNQTDFFSLGTVAYQVVTGKVPFDGNTENELINAIVKEPLNLDELRAGDINNVELLLFEKLMAKDPQDRFVDTVELLATLQEINSLQYDPQKYMPPGDPPKSPRKYLMYTVLVILIIILWLALTTVTRLFG